MQFRSCRSSLAVALAFGAMALAGCSTGSPEAVVKDTSPARLLTGDTFLTGLGLQRGGSTERPDNLPRAKLVIPPERNLPAPESGSTYASANAAWPSDPDEARARRLAELRERDEANSADDYEKQKYILETRRTLAEGDQPLAKRPPGARVSARQYERETEEAIKEMKRGARVARALRAEEAARPRRRTLMDPPEEYTQAPENVPDAPVTEKKKKRFWLF